MKFRMYAVIACILLLSSQAELLSQAEKTSTTQKKPTDAEVASFVNKIKDGKLPQSGLGPILTVLSKVGKSVISGDIIGIKIAEADKLPRELSRATAIALKGTITFLNQPTDCTIIFGKYVDPSGAPHVGISLDISLGKSYKVKDFPFFTHLGVPSNALDKFGNIDLPQPHLIFSTFDFYTYPGAAFAVRAGVTLSTKTKVAALMNLVKKEVNNLTNGNANKLPFLANVNDDSPVVFNLVVEFKGDEFKSFRGEIALPMELGIDIAKLRAQEKRFRPKIKAPFTDLNKPIKAVTSIVNSPPLNKINKIAIGNFVASIGVATEGLDLFFGAELNVTTSKGARYGLRGTVGLTPTQLAVELQKSPSIESMPLGAGISIENIAIATYTDFELLASGVPFSGLGLLGEISFPFGDEKISIGLAGKIEVSGDFLLMGSVKNFNASKLALFYTHLIENLARAVKFDTSKLTQAMKHLPRITINEGLVYVSTKIALLGGRIFPLGLGVSLDVLINNMNAKMAVAGNTRELAMMGYMSKISTPYIILSGAGPDKRYGTKDDGPLIDFLISANDPTKARFYASAKVSFPPVKISGQGDLYLGLASIDAKFSANVANLFKAQFNVAFNPRNIPASKIEFGLDNKERRNFMAVALSQLNKEIAKAQRGAAKIVLLPFRAITKELSKGINNLKIQIPSQVFGSLTARTWSGTMGINGGGITFPGIGRISLHIPTVSFSLKDPAKAIGEIAKKWAQDIIKKIESPFKEIGKELEKGAEIVRKRLREAGIKIKKSTKTIGKKIKKGAKKAKKEAKKAAKKIGSAFGI